MLVHELLDNTAVRFPCRTALRHEGRDYSYDELRQRSVQVAAGLSSLGVARGDRVVVCLSNRPEVVELAIACSRLGAMIVPVSPLLRQRQLSRLLQDCDPRIVVVTDIASLSGLDPGRWTTVVVEPPKGAAEEAQVLRYESLQLEGSDVACGHIDCDPAGIFYTSGSTGRAKGVVVSHRNLVSGALSVASYLKSNSDDRVLVALPLSFDYGFNQVTTAFSVGACAVLTQYSLPAALIEEIVRERITGLAGVPTMWVRLAASEWPGEAAEHMRYITNSGGEFPVSTIQDLRKKLPNTEIYSMYGLTEAFRSTYLPPSELDRRPTSIGKAIPNQEVLVVRPDGTPCEPGEVGELVHRGSLVALGYWNDPELTAAKFRAIEGRLPQLPIKEVAVWSGDFVKQDEEGYLYFVGRRDALIKTSGYRVSPQEVEEVVAEVPGVSEAVAVGLPDPVLGHRIAVAVTLRDPEAATLPERVRHYCRTQLPAYMVPSDIRVVDEIPVNVNGKYDRAAVAALLASAQAR